MPNPIPKEHINYILTHVILPPKLPSEDDSNNACDFAFCQILTSAVESFKSHATAAEKDVWTRVEGLTRHLGDLTEAMTRERIRRALTMAQPGDLRAVYMRSQNACMLFTRQEAETLVTAWEASPRAKDVLKPTGKLICSYPGPAVAIPNSELDDAVARDELSSVLAQLALYDTSAIPMTHKAGSSVPEEREAADPAYITNFVMAVLRGKGRAADVQRFSKRVADDSIAASSTKPWRRSPLWLSIRVAMQASLPEAQYKAFMIYFHAYLVDIAVNMKYGSEVLYFGQAKMARRLHKLPQAPAFVGAAVTQVVDRAQGLLGTRWKAIRLEQEKSAPWDPATLDLPAATHQPLTNSREYLLQALNGNNERPAAVEFNPKERPRMRDIDELSEFIEHAAFKGAEPRLALMDFERAIRNNIDAWTDRNLYDKQAAIVVGECMVQYLDLALVQYKDSAEDQSYMILTAMELWVALDKIVLEQYPLMKEYLPVIPSSFLQPTLLRHTETIHRANEIQKYLRVREMQAQAQDHLQSIFSPDAVNDTSFSVRYYDEAEALQQLHREIQRKARDERMIKRDELSTLNGKHASLRRTADKMRHEYTEERVHKAACPRCALETRINDMKIDMHEWPLPEDENAAKNVVFELNVPFPSAMWRSCTYRVLVDIGSTQPRGYSGTSYRLDKYEPLTHWSSKWFPDRRVTVASSQASFSHSHFSRVSIPATETSVLVNCTLHLRLFDSECHSLASGPFITDILDRCTLKLPKTGPYATLDFAVRGTTHTPNQVIAMQGDCPDGLSPFEHHTYCMVRCGARLQTLKVIEQITSQGLTWGREEVNTLLAQTMWQLGWLSQDGALREWHQDLENKKIALRLLETSMERLKSIESNWLEAVTVRSLVTIVARLLASTVDGTSEVARQAYIFMRKARDVTYQWMHNLADELQSVMDQQRLSEFQSRLCDVAATCRATYDVDDKHLASLFSSRGDVAQFLECSATLNDNAPPLANKVDQALKAVLNRDRRLAHYLERTLERKLNNDWGSPILKQAITAVWPGYRPRSSSWEALPVPNSRWVTARTRHDAADGAQQIHFNLLDGRLLVNGKPLGRLPKDIVVHPLYVRIFGKKILNVIHSEMLGMEFCTRTEISGYRVHFYLNMARKDLIIRAQRGAQVLQIIPHNILENDFPAFFTRGQTHWLDLESKRMEFRPMASLWKTSPSNWTLHFSHTHSSYMVQGASPTKLVDVRSPVASMIHGRISRFEKPIYTNITYDSSSSLLLANLPRSRLAFSLNNAGDLESRNLPGMVIDNNQSIGALFGLVSRLVLRPRDPRTQPRRVLIPTGKIGCVLDGHTHVVIDTGDNDRIQYHSYRIDVELERLKGSGTLQSELFKAYLHALTGHFLQDPLTGMTGTEEALRGLAQPRCHSFQRLGPDERETLRLLASLSPKMLYYPPRAGITNIQMIKWMPNLSSFNQHPRFLDIACSIMDTAKTQEMFFDDPVNLSADGLDSVAAVSNPHLMARATRRIAVFYPPDFTGNPFVECADVPYLARDVADGPGRGREAAVCQIARTVAAWQPGLPVDISLVPIRALGTMGPGRVLGTGQFDSLGFSLERNLDLHANFLTLLDLCRGGLSSHVKKCQLSFRLGFYAYHEAEEARALLPIFIAFATIPTFRQLRLPSHPSYTPSDGVTPVPVRIAEIARTAAVPLTSSPTWHSEKQGPSERYKTYVTRVTTIYESKLRRYSGEFAQAFLAQTDRPPNIPRAAPWFNMGQCVASVQSYYASCRHNVVLRAFTEQTIQVLDQYRVQTPPFVREYMFGTNLAHDPPCLASAVSFSALLDQRSPPIPRTPLRSFQGQAVEYDRPADTENLRAILSEFTSSSDVLHQRYGSDLEKSRKDLDGGMVPIVPTEHAPAEDVDRHLDQAKGQMVIYFNLIRSALQPSEDSSAEIAMERAGLWPSLTRRTVLERLSHTLIDGLPRGWQRSIVAFALRLLEFQRSSRLLGLALKGNPEEFAKEANNKVTDVEASPEHPDWLLIQIDGDFLARKLQLDVAREMISPSTGANMALQLNMGEGKSSVIVPLVSAALADGDQLARIVVLKALTVQMFHLLVDRLCGLAGRRIFYLPFSRNVHLSTDNVSKVQDLYTQCVQEKGVMIPQPEHLLSYRLKGMDVRLHRSANGDVVIADKLAESQQWLSQHARDILDESDEILHVRNQLNYTVGTQRPIEDHPDRWTTTQQVFGVVARIFAAIQTLYPSQVELRDHCRSRFPSIRVLGPDAARSLVEKVATQAFAGNIPNLAFALLHGPTKQAAYNFIISSVIDENDYSHLKSHLADSSSLWKGLLLLRGLLGNGILDHVLSQRRYRVDYGLDPRRTMLAVPYRAKDVPSLRSEFGHQDVGICLTILSYYYEGITSAQLHQCFGLLHKQDNPSLEYENWVKKVDGLPVALRQLTGVNTRDVDQFNDVLFPHLGRCHAVVDFFLSQVVFPKEAKEFPEKLASSPWDLIDLTERVTTGFSGTNDNRYLLPTSIEQCDPVNQLSTNARVLMYLLQPENGNYICTQNAGEGPRSVDSFLQLLVEQDPQPRVLLDVGAQMLDKQNKDLVWDWLLLMPNVDAAIFFTDSDELTVLARDGTVEPFISSPFNQQLDRCIVYLDDAHTRGTDLKLPRDYHAAVTLGPKVTKDRLLQGCMRMRKLGHGQSVMFCAPAEVDTRILEARTNANPAAAVGPVAVLDIIRWAMLVSIDDVRRNVPQWAQQGMDQARRHTALAIYSNPGANSQPASEAEKIEMLKGAWLQPEARTLEVLYGRRHGTEQSLYQLAQTFPLIAARLELIGVTSLSDSRMEEEQEREVSHEMERERQIERPPQAQPAEHVLDASVTRLVSRGTIQPNTVFMPLHLPLRSLPTHQWPWSACLLATRDFGQTVLGVRYDELSDYLRPVNWILSTVVDDAPVLVAISPFEANELLPAIRKSKKVHLHQYTPRVTQTMRSFDDLQFNCIPPLPEDWAAPPRSMQLQLDVYAGQLYLPDAAAYIDLCAFLGVYTREFEGLGQPQSDGFIKPEHRRGILTESCKFDVSPLALLKELFGLRRKGTGFASTHMGKILHARLLQDDDFT